jgi:hypothetical protein
MAKSKNRRIGAFRKRLAFSDLDGRTNAGRYVDSIKNDLEKQIGIPSAAQQILIKLIAMKVLRCEMMHDQVLSNPNGGNLQDRVEDDFLAWSNSIRRDLEALGLLGPPSNAEALLSIDPHNMTDEQLAAAIALVHRHQAIILRAVETRLAEIKTQPKVSNVESAFPSHQDVDRHL